MKVYQAKVPAPTQQRFQIPNTSFNMMNPCLFQPQEGELKELCLWKYKLISIRKKIKKRPDPSSTVFMKSVFPLHKFSFFPLQDTNVTWLSIQKSKTLIETTEKY